MANIFVIDDALELAVLVKTLLEEDNHDISIFPEAQQALAALETKIPDLVMVDVMMPKMDGYTFCMKLLEDARFKDLPVLILTAKGNTRDVFAPLPNVVSFIEKPYNRVVLSHMVERALEGRKRA